MPDIEAGELCVNRLVAPGRLPKELGNGAELFGFDSLANVEAVDSQLGQLVHDWRRRLIAAFKRHAIEMDVAVNDVDAQLGTKQQMLPHRLV